MNKDEIENNRKKTICIFAAMTKVTEPWDPDSTKHGITGSFEAVIYLSNELAKLGYQVTVIGNPPKNSQFTDVISNPRYVPEDFVPTSKYDYAISWRVYWSIKLLINIAHKVYFWPHDIALKPYQKDIIESYDEIFWLSNWQRNQWVTLNPSLAKYINIYGNGINPDEIEPMTERTNPYSCIYASNYGRGLETLINCWPAIKKRFPKATLDIYYGWCSWSGLTAEQEVSLKNKISQLEPLDVKEHGLVGHKELHKAYSKASFWTYPCNGNETFCISAIKAQASGAIPVIITNSALQETVRHGYTCTTPEEYLSILLTAMQNAENITLQERIAMKQSVIEKYTWKNIAEKWKAVFDKNAPI